MSNLGRCELTDLFYAECAHCLGLKTVEEEQEELDRGMIKLAERLNDSRN